MHGIILMDHKPHLQFDMGLLLQSECFNEQNGTF